MKLNLLPGYRQRCYALGSRVMEIEAEAEAQVEVLETQLLWHKEPEVCAEVEVEEGTGWRVAPGNWLAHVKECWDKFKNLVKQKRRAKRE